VRETPLLAKLSNTVPYLNIIMYNGTFETYNQSQAALMAIWLENGKGQISPPQNRHPSTHRIAKNCHK